MGVPQFMMGVWYGTSLVYMVWYIVGLYGMVHRWFIWYGTYIVGFLSSTVYDGIWYGTLLGF